jgi:hypothetical protein
LQNIPLLRRLRNCEKSANAFTVEAEVLVAAVGHQTASDDVKNYAGAACILMEAVSQSLIGKVNERNDTAFTQQTGDLFPLVGVEVGTSRIVTTSLQQSDIAWLGAAKCLEYGIERQLLGSEIEVVIVYNLEADGFQDKSVVRPCRFSQPDTGMGTSPRDEFGSQAQRSGAAGRL